MERNVLESAVKTEIDKKREREREGERERGRERDRQTDRERERQRERQRERDIERERQRERVRTLLPVLRHRRVVFSFSISYPRCLPVFVFVLFGSFFLFLFLSSPSSSYFSCSRRAVRYLLFACCDVVVFFF